MILPRDHTPVEQTIPLNASQRHGLSNCMNREQMDNTLRLVFIKLLKGAELHPGQIDLSEEPGCR